jgi:transcription elongation factor Elf1
MEKYCQNPLCENEAVKQVPVSVGKASDQKRALCAVCEEVYTWGVQHGQRSKPGLQIAPPPKESGPEPLYRVVYVIDVNALQRRQAAQCAYEMMSDPASLRPVLHVLDDRGRDRIVDLAHEPPGAGTKARPEDARQMARAFVLAGGTQCPVCGRQEIDFGAVTLDAECAYQEASCRHCQAQFCSIYRLAGYGLHVDDSLEVHTIAEDFGPSKDAGG